MAINRIDGTMLEANLLRQGDDFAVETNLIYFDVANSRIGIGNSGPTTTLDITGDTTMDGRLIFDYQPPNATTPIIDIINTGLNSDRRLMHVAELTGGGFYFDGDFSPSGLENAFVFGSDIVGAEPELWWWNADGDFRFSGSAITWDKATTTLTVNSRLDVINNGLSSVILDLETDLGVNIANLTVTGPVADDITSPFTIATNSTHPLDMSGVTELRLGSSTLDFSGYEISGTSSALTLDAVGANNQVIIAGSGGTAGSIYSDSSSKLIGFLSSDGNWKVQVTGAATGVDLYYNTTVRAATTADGLDVTGELDVSTEILFTERADHVFTPAATRGILWLRTATPNELIFTDDAGTDWLLNQAGAGTIGGSIADNQVAIGNGTDAIDGSAALTFDGTELNTTGYLTTSNAAPELRFEETDEGVGDKNWRWRVFGQQLTLNLADDSWSTSTNGITISRSLNTMTQMAINGTEFRLNSAGGTMTFQEAATPSLATNSAGVGKLWVRNDTPNSLIFTADDGTEYDLTSYGTGDGDVTKVGTPVNDQIGVWTGDGTLEGDANFTWNGSALTFGSGSMSGAALQLDGAIPTLAIRESDAGVDQKRWYTTLTAGVLTSAVEDDSFANDYTYQTITRSGTGVGVQVDTIDFTTATDVTVNSPTFHVAGNITLTGTVDGIDIATDVAANTAKVSNATHTGQVTGATALALDVTAITAQPASGAIVATDTILINDGGVLSEATFTQMDTYFNSSLSFGDVTAGTQADNQVAVWNATAKQIEGDANLTWDGTVLTVTGQNVTMTDGALSVTQTAAAERAGYFYSNTATRTVPVVEIINDNGVGSGHGLQVQQDQGGDGVHVTVSGNSSAFYATTTGPTLAGKGLIESFIDNASSSGYAISGRSNATVAAIHGEANSTGTEAARFTSNIASRTVPVVNIVNDNATGAGDALRVQNDSGTGSAIVALGNVEISANTPRLTLEETDGALDQKRWTKLASAESLIDQVVDDAIANAYTYMSVQRSGTGASVQVDTIDFTAVTDVTVNSKLVVNGGGDFGNDITISDAAPNLILNESDQGLNEKNWVVGANGTEFFINAFDDALSSSNAALVIDRAGTVVSTITLSAVNAISLLGPTTVGADLTIRDTNPFIVYDETSAAVDNGIWLAGCNGERYIIAAYNDALSAGNTALLIERTGTNIDSITLETDQVDMYSNAANIDVNIGRNVAERLNISVVDSDLSFTYYQDETDATPHDVNWNIVSTSTGTHDYVWQYNSTELLKLDKAGHLTVASSLTVKQGAGGGVVFDTDADSYIYASADDNLIIATANIAALTLGATQTATFSADVDPTVTNTQDIGASGLVWANVWATTFEGTATTAQYADLAEKYLTDAEYEIGTVLMFGGEQEVTEATPSTTAIAGIVSEKPAFLMNKKLANSAIVALRGRVPCKVYGPVAKGDLMVAGTGGVAVADNNANPNAVLGRAIATNDDGYGYIEVVV